MIRQRGTSPLEKDQLTEEQKFVVPNYTIKQLLDAIPAHCFHRSTIKSFQYVVQDFAALGVLAYAAFHIDDFLAKFSLAPIVHQIARISLYAMYTFAAGLFGTGLWIIGHECGHGGFSANKRISNITGWVLHSFLLVPYYSWKISHAQHHAATGHLTRDQVFCPKTRKELGIMEVKEEGEVQGLNITETRQMEMREALSESPIATLFNMFLHQVFGWPMYLFMNASGQSHYPAWTNHFSPSSVMFKSSQKWQILVSDLGVCLTLACLGFWGFKRSFAEVAVMYGIPYLFVNHWLVMITFLQHTDPLLPHYTASKWTFPRGALATIDRTFMGPIGAYVLHGICETHVAHHISSKMPHYNAWEATEALKAFLGPHYYRSEESMFTSFYKSYRDCLFIEDGEEVVFYKNASGMAKRVAVEEGGNISDSGIDMSESK